MNYIKKITSFVLSLTLLSSSLWSMEQNIDVQKKEISLRRKITVALEGSSFVFYKETINKLSEKSEIIEIGRISDSHTYLNNLLLFMCWKHDLPFDIKDYIAHLLSSLVAKNALACNFELSKTLIGHSGWVNSATFSPDGKTVLTGSWDGTARLWNAATGELIKQFNGHSDQVYSVVFSPDGKTVLTGSRDGTACLWNTSTGELIKQLNGPSWDVCLVGFNGGKDVYSVAFNSDGKTVLTGSGKTTCLWNVTTGELIKQLKGHSSYVSSVAFSPDGKTVLTGSHDKTACLWNATTGELITQFKGHSNYVSSVAFNPDGKTIFTGSRDHAARLWNTTTGKLITQLNGHSFHVSSVAFSPDGKTIITGSHDGTACLWNTTTEELIKQLQHSDSVNSVAFSPDSKTVLTGSRDKTACLWSLLPCEATTWILNKANPFQVWLISKASQEKKTTDRCIFNENSLEYELFNELPKYVQDYLTKWYSITIAFDSNFDSDSENNYLGAETD